MGVGTWSPRPHLDLARLLAEPAERDRLQGELREHGQRLACVNAAGNPLAPAAGARSRGAGRAARSDRAGRAARRRHGRDDERLPGRPRRERLDRRVRRLLAVLRRRAALGVAVPRARRALLARALGLGRDGCPGRAHLPRAASRADDLRGGQLRAPARRGRRERRHQPRPEPLLVAGRRPARDRRAARRRDRLRARQGHAAAPRAHPRERAARRPLSRSIPTPPRGTSPPSARAARSRSGGRCSRPCAQRATTASSRSSTRIRRCRAEASIEASAVALREALAWQ